MFLRIFLWCFVRAWYRPIVLGPGKVPAKGGALVVSNHLSFLDMLLILSSTPRFVRFLLPADICGLWWLKPCLRYLRAGRTATRSARKNQYPRREKHTMRRAGVFFNKFLVDCGRTGRP